MEEWGLTGISLLFGIEIDYGDLFAGGLGQVGREEGRLVIYERVINFTETPKQSILLQGLEMGATGTGLGRRQRFDSCPELKCHSVETTRNVASKREEWIDSFLHVLE